MMIDNVPAPPTPEADIHESLVADPDDLDGEPWMFDFRSYLEDPE